MKFVKAAKPKVVQLGGLLGHLPLRIDSMGRKVVFIGGIGLAFVHSFAGAAEMRWPTLENE
jgi:hypothetical protein